MMKLWLLKRIGNVGYDECAGFVIRASSLSAARALAATACGDEGKEVWLNAATSTCEPLPEDGLNDEIILTDFRAG